MKKRKEKDYLGKVRQDKELEMLGLINKLQKAESKKAGTTGQNSKGGQGNASKDR